jgi:hypothetical protein
MGRAFGKVIGIFSTNQNGSKLEDENGADLDLEVPARGQDKKRRRGDDDLPSHKPHSQSGKSDTTAMDEDDSGSDLDAQLAQPPSKKSKGRPTSHDMNDSVAAKGGKGGSGKKAKIQRAAKRVGNATSASPASHKTTTNKDHAKRAANERHDAVPSRVPPKSWATSKSTSTAHTSTSRGKPSSSNERPSGKSSDEIGKVAARGSGTLKNKKVEIAAESDDSELEDDAGSDGEAMDDALSEEEDLSEELEVSVEEEEEIEVRWPPMPTKVEEGTEKQGHIVYYSWVELAGVRLSRGDSVYLRSGGKTPYVAKLVELRHDEESGSTCRVAWWYRKGDLDPAKCHSTLSDPIDPKELIESSELETNPIQSISISKKPKILFGNDKKTKQEAASNPDSFFYYRFYDSSTGKVQSLL